MKKRLLSNLKQKPRESSKSSSSLESRKRENSSWLSSRWTRCIKIKLRVSAEGSKLSTSRKEGCLRKRRDEDCKTSSLRLKNLTSQAVTKKSSDRRSKAWTERPVICRTRSRRLRRSWKLRTWKRDSSKETLMNSQSKLTVRSSLLKMSLRRYPGWGKSWQRSRLRFRRLRGSTRSFLSRNLKASTAALQSKRREVLLKTWTS